jgi:glycine/D-amino acid oxidase-like deaminating enzyme/nitrite reductase/ring-hydroxylating ferredoxin subunit
LWMRVEVAPDAQSLSRSLICDTVVIGAGIAGLSAAFELSQEGQNVVVLDRGAICRGMTARTTAHLAPVCDDGLSALISMRGEAVARLFQRSQEAAVDRIESIVGHHAISCDFRRLDAFLFPAMSMPTKDAKKQVEKEYDAARALGVAAECVTGVPLKGFEKAPVLKYSAQATFHPLKYLKGLVEAITATGSQLFAHTPVISVEENEAGVRVATESGKTVTARHAIVATNSPISDHVEIHSKMAPYRTYAMAFTIPRGALPDALYWDMADPYHYVRLSTGPGETDYLIAGGADHKSGEANDGSVRFEAVEAWIRALVPGLGKEVHRWSGQVLDTMDYCGFIGRDPGTNNVFIATGDSGQGITHGIVASLLLKDLILTGETPWQDAYDPSRKTPAGVGNYLRENVTAIKKFAESMLPGEIEAVEELKPGDGGIIRDGVERIAVSRDAKGILHLVSSTCTHLGCHVHWNSTEQCWDCPCHGSQFAADGAVLNGPAITPLSPAHFLGKR